MNQNTHENAKDIDALRGEMSKRLIDAVKQGDFKTVEALLKDGVNPNAHNPRVPLDALATAAGLGNERIVHLLLTYGANPNTLDLLAGTSPLHNACQGGNPEVVKRLVEAGAMIDLQTATTGHTPLMDAIWFKRPEITAYLLDAGAGLNQLTHYGFTLTDHLRYEQGVNPRDQEKLERCAQLVEERRASDRKKVSDQKLMAAVMNGDPAAAEAQLKAGANVDERHPILDSFNDWHTPLLVAARDGHTEIVKLLLEYGADVNAVENTFGAVPLHKATYNGRVEITRILASQPGINLDFQGASNGYTPLHDALWHGFDECARVLVEAGARLDLLAYDGKLPIDIAIDSFGDQHPILEILEPGPDARSKPRANLIPWHSRQRSGARAIAEQLKIAGFIGASENLLIGNPGSGEEWLYLEMVDEVRMGLAEPAVGAILDGAGRVRNQPAVAIAHGFVGFSGLQGAVFNAAQRQSPMLVIVGVADSQAHTGETHMYADVEGAAKAARAKYVKNATDSTTLLRDLRDAIVEARIPPFGPVVFIVGSNIASAPNTESAIAPKLPNIRLAPPVSEIELLADQMLDAKTPAMLIGDGVARSDGFAELQEVAELLAADVWASMESEINFPRNHPLFRGNLGHMDDSVGRELLRETDFALAVGTPIYQTVFNSKLPLFRAGVPVAAINQDPETTLRGHNDVAFPIKGDPKRILGMLADVLKKKQTEEQAARVKAAFEARQQQKGADLGQRREAQLREPGVTMAKFANLLEAQMKEMSQRPVIFNEALAGATGLTDYIGNVDMPGKYFDTSGGSLGEWGGAVGAAMIGGPTIAFIGDGGFNYVLQSLWNASRDKLPLGLVVAHNGNYGLLYANMDATMRKHGIEPASVPNPHFFELPGIDYVKIGQGYGVPGMRVEKEDDLKQAVDRLVEFNGPFLIDLVLQ
uniref:Acetolactate synthase large subunit n=1 Tax=Candidatus Kentrum sp. MB TaxID=2138164 RepID=A0A451BEJ2_9GAMM|nr:MAG: Acetolactate synthase large subunit [Candidatus Kentron sp. MB]VFK76696.1 MAG: Acetolactate synthase large subunit [Candidatus Kentron sp. MB]